MARVSKSQERRKKQRQKNQLLAKIDTTKKLIKTIILE